MDVFVFGVGRSGTTMLYRLVQEILLSRSGRDFESIYEPFIWNPAVFDGLYEDTTRHFGQTRSVSIAGIYAHLATPLFVKEPGPLDDYLRLEVFQLLAARGESRDRVAKLIRGNGRMAIFRALNPAARFVLLTRNPTENVNSLKNKFSFYGDDFYPSDWPRFVAEVGDQRIVHQPDWAAQQAEYSLQMNRAALGFARRDDATLVLEFDNFRSDKAAAVRALCCFLDVDCEERDLDRVSSSIGPVTPRVALSEAEFESAFRYDAPYDELCAAAGIERARGGHEVAARFAGRCTEPPVALDYQGLTTNRLRNILLERESELAALRAEFEKRGAT